MADESIGPLITVAAFCEKTLDEKDGVPSLIRLIDRIYFAPPPVPIRLEDGKPVDPAIQVSLYMRFTTFHLEGTYTLRLVVKNPLGKETEILNHKIAFDVNRTGLNFKVELTLGVRDAGWYWTRVYLDDQFFTQIPLEVVLSEPSEIHLKK